MQDKGFEVDFPPAATQALEKMQVPDLKISAPVRDLRSLSWCSIDNDDSEDLDQYPWPLPCHRVKQRFLLRSPMWIRS